MDYKKEKEHLKLGGEMVGERGGLENGGKGSGFDQNKMHAHVKFSSNKQGKTNKSRASPHKHEEF